MPNQPLRACTFPRCPNMAVVRSIYCEQHQPEDTSRERDAARREKDPWRNWYKLEPWYQLCELRYSEDPICQDCGRNETEVFHHIKDHRGNWDLFIDQHNIRCLCKSCHDRNYVKPAPGKPVRTHEGHCMLRRNLGVCTCAVNDASVPV